MPSVWKFSASKGNDLGLLPLVRIVEVSIKGCKYKINVCNHAPRQNHNMIRNHTHSMVHLVDNNTITSTKCHFAHTGKQNLYTIG